MTDGAETGRGRVLGALNGLANSRVDVADALADFLTVVADEASRNRRFANRLAEALIRESTEPSKITAPRTRRARREPGPWDPYTVHAELGEDGLRQRLSELDLEQLRNIIAEHGMDTDRLAMKWRDPDRVVARIVDRVVERATKGDAFRPG